MTRINRLPILEDMVDITNKRIIDYGGHNGDLLFYSQGRIKEKDYTVIDVDSNALTEGKKEFPNANWIHNDIFNYVYNQTESELTFPTLKSDYDYIFSFSVFTHTDLNELVETLKWMISLEPKKIMLSFVDTTNKSMIEWFYERRIKEYGWCIDFRNIIENICYVLDNDIILNNVTKPIVTNNDFFITFYRSDFLLQYLREHNIICRIEKPEHSSHDFIIWEKQ